MKRHIRYWHARLRNDLLRLCLIGPNERQFVEEVMSKLRRDRRLSDLMDDVERKRKEAGGQS